MTKTEWMERNSFNEMFKTIQRSNEVLIENYKSIDHSTGNTLTIDYSDIEE